MFTFTCQTDDCHAYEVAEESEGGRETTSVVKLIVFMHQLLFFFLKSCADWCQSAHTPTHPGLTPGHLLNKTMPSVKDRGKMVCSIVVNR